MDFTNAEFWIALMQIIGVNIVLSGDNAVVIALAARGLPQLQQRRAVAWGSGAAVVLRIVLTIVAVELLRLPYLKLAGAALLLWIAVQLLLPDDAAEGDGEIVTGLGSAIKTILLADLVMSLDNVIAVAAAAKGNIVLLVIGLAISIPIVIFASRLLLTLMDRFPIIITFGAGLLGWVGGDMAVSDPVVKPWVDAEAPFLHWGAPMTCALAVVVVGRWLAGRRSADRVVSAPVAAPAAAGGGLRRVLLAVDGSHNAALAVQRLIAIAADLRDRAGLEVHLTHVQRPVSGDVSRFLSGQTLEDYYQERGEAAVASARAALLEAGLSPRVHQRLGEPGPELAEAARTLGCDLIVMGARGMGASAAALLGSVTQSTIEHATTPVLIVK